LNRAAADAYSEDVRAATNFLWPDGETEVIKGFLTEYDAAKWIAEHSKAWSGNTNDKPPQTRALGTTNKSGSDLSPDPPE
jgi:hypothetical protein